MLHHTISGHGSHSIVLLHGFCENNTCFNKQVLLLKDQFQVICIDLPGFGESSDLDATSMEQMADLVYATLKTIGVQQGVMVGHSMGGYVTLAFAKKYPNSLKGFCLLHSTATADSDERKQKREQAIAFIEQNGHEAYVKAFIPPLFASNYPNQTDISDAILQGLRTSPKGLIQALHAMKQREDSVDFIKQSLVPIMYMIGSHDNLIPSMDLLKQVAVLRHGKLIMLEQSGHMGMIEEPEKCAHAIADFAHYCLGIS
jgi:pimeloyl-ACP methyl ester carboxylesterase